MLWTRVTSRASSRVSGGRIDGRRRASMVLPALGAPSGSMLYSVLPKSASCRSGLLLLLYRAACQVFRAARSRAMVNRRGRKEVTDRIIVAAAAGLECIEQANSCTVQRAWRLTVEARLAENRVIALSQSQRSVTHFSEEDVSLSFR